MCRRAVVAADVEIWAAACAAACALAVSSAPPRDPLWKPGTTSVISRRRPPRTKTKTVDRAVRVLLRVEQHLRERQFIDRGHGPLSRASAAVEPSRRQAMPPQKLIEPAVKLPPQQKLIEWRYRSLDYKRVPP